MLTRVTLNSLADETIFIISWLTFSDLPGKGTYLKNLLAHLFLMDAAILVINSDEGVLDTTRSHYCWAKHVGVKHVVTFINHKPGEDPEEVGELIKMELEEFMTEDGDFSR